MHKGTTDETLITGEIPGIDPNIKRLVAEINKIPGLQTTGSCGGHYDALMYQCVMGTFLVTINVEWTADGLLSLERLIWATCFGPLNGLGHITMHSAPPFLNYPRKTLYFAWDGVGDPERAADELAKCFAVNRPAGIRKAIKSYVQQPDEMPANVFGLIDWLDGFAGITTRRWDKTMEEAIAKTAEEPAHTIAFAAGTTETARNSLEFITWILNQTPEADLIAITPGREDPWNGEDLRRVETVFIVAVQQEKAGDVIQQLNQLTHKYFR